MGKGRLLVVSCRYCGLLVAAGTHFGSEEMETLLAHVRSCTPSTRLPEAPGVKAVLRHFDVRRTNEREE